MRKTENLQKSFLIISYCLVIVSPAIQSRGRTGNGTEVLSIFSTSPQNCAAFSSTCSSRKCASIHGLDCVHRAIGNLVRKLPPTGMRHSGSLVAKQCCHSANARFRCHRSLPQSTAGLRYQEQDDHRRSKGCTAHGLPFAWGSQRHEGVGTEASLPAGTL